MQNEQRNTYEEAEIYANTHPVILVTNATHMPRAMMSFKNYGIELISSPTNYRLLGSWKKKKLGLPSMKNIENTESGYFRICRSNLVSS